MYILYIYIGCRCIISIDYWNWVCTLIPVIPICLLHSLLWPSMRIRLLKCPSLVVVGHLNIWNPGGDLGVPAFLHRLTAASDLETSVVGTGGWIRDESSWAKGGWSWPQITWSHLILKGLLTSVDRLKKNCISTYLNGFGHEVVLGHVATIFVQVFCGISASLGG